MWCKELRAKGFDTAVLGKWLLAELEKAPDWCNKIYMLVWAADFVLVALHAADFLPERVSQQVTVVGEYFVKLYVTLAHEERGRWMIRPKLHLFHHLVCFPSECRSRRSPHMDATWMDEDWVKKTARILKRTHKLTCARNTVSRYLVLLKQRLDEK